MTTERQWVVLLDCFIEDQLSSSDDAVSARLDLYEIDEECERLMDILRAELGPALEGCDYCAVRSALIRYEIQMNHLWEHAKRLRVRLPKIIEAVDSRCED